jgi:RimJ/RimL family protein N-acetyltransferase
MRFTVRAMTEADARAMAAWRYDAPYELYSLQPEDVDELLDPAMDYVAVDDEDGELAGFFCFGSSARVPGGEGAGLYVDEALDIGLGLRPDLTGRGFGATFVDAGVAHAVKRRQPVAVRLSVATFNQRAIRVYERVGFAPVGRCVSPVGGVETAFVVMRRPIVSAPPGHEQVRKSDEVSD